VPTATAGFRLHRQRRQLDRSLACSSIAYATVHVVWDSEECESKARTHAATQQQLRDRIMRALHHIQSHKGTKQNLISLSHEIPACLQQDHHHIHEMRGKVMKLWMHCNGFEDARTKALLGQGIAGRSGGLVVARAAVSGQGAVTVKATNAAMQASVSCRLVQCSAACATALLSISACSSVGDPAGRAYN
jgi:sulfur transfer protein SufE